MKNLMLRSGFVSAIVIVCVLLFAPNFLEQELKIVFKKERRLENGEKKAIDMAEIENFLQNKEKGLSLYFPGLECVMLVPEKGGDDSSAPECHLKGRFITAARINEMSQGYPDLINDLKTGLLPHPIERFVGGRARNGFKNLKIKLGLDLQGGMRATFRADYESYLAKLNEKYLPRVKDLTDKLNTAKNASEKKDLQAQIDSIHEILNIDDLKKIQLLREAQNVIIKRLDGMNLSEPEVRIQEGSHSIGVDMPGVTNSSNVLRQLKDTVTVEYRIVNREWTDKLNRTYLEEIARITEIHRRGKVDHMDVEDIISDVRKKSGLKDSDGKIFLHWRRGAKKTSAVLPREFRVLGPSVLDGEDMTNAQNSINPNTGFYQINFELSAAGTEIFANVTRENVGKQLAILWGDRVVSDPNIREPIVGGSGRIDGDFDLQQAESVSAVIREGALPLPLELMSVSFIGPSLGQDSIVAGVASVLLGFLMVMIFMIAYYKLAGIVANFALLLNLLMVAGILSLLEFTLTLPGFAGIILTVGMAVDANVIIFEKIKEELRQGKSPSIAIDSGFHASFWTILDANVTTLIAAVILWKVGDQFGDSAIKGFSITLFFGLLSSMFTALYVSKLSLDWILHLWRPKRLSIGYGLYKGEKV